jgi:hypothetical protein
MIVLTVHARESENERLPRFEKREIFGAHLAGTSVKKTATL